MGMLAIFLTALVSFLLGSIPFGLLIGKFFYQKDIRSVGSGNIGTTNAMRAMGFKGGAAVFLLDFGKGLLSGAIALALLFFMVPGGGLVSGSIPTYAQLVSLAFLCCVVGHIYSPWLHFKGGKGIAVAVGCLFITFGPVGALLELALFAVLVVASKYVSLGSIAAALACPFFALYFFWGDWLAVALCSLAAFLVLWAHRGNIQRLLAGEEPKVGEKHEEGV